MRQSWRCRWRIFLSKSEQILALIVEARVKKILGEFALFQVLTSINQEWQGQSNRVGEANHNYERLIHWNSKTSENDTDHWRMSINHCRLHDKTAHLTMYSGEGKKKLMLHFHCQRQPALWGHWRLMLQYDLQRLHGIPKIYMLQTGCMFLSREPETLSVSVCLTGATSSSAIKSTSVWEENGEGFAYMNNYFFEQLQLTNAINK